MCRKPLHRGQLRLGVPWSILVLFVSSLILSGCHAESAVATNESSQETTDQKPPAPEPIGDADPEPEQDSIPEVDQKGIPFPPLIRLSSVEADFLDVRGLAFAPDGKTFVTGGGTPKIWKVGQEEPLHEFDDLFPLTGLQVTALAVAITPDGKTLAIGADDGKLHLFDYASYEKKQELQPHPKGIVSVSCSKDGKIMATSGYDGKVVTFKTGAEKPTAVIQAQPDKMVFSQVSPDGKSVVAAWEVGAFWNAETGEKIGEFRKNDAYLPSVLDLSFSPDGKLLATAEANEKFQNAVLIRSVKTRKLTATLRHEYGVSALAFSPDGKLIATTSVNGIARIWRMDDRALVQKIEDDEFSHLNNVAWSPDGKRLVIVDGGMVMFYGRDK